MTAGESAAGHHGPLPAYRDFPEGDLLLRETNHRCANDLQLVVSLLALQSRRAQSAETRQALADTMDRVAVLARARAALIHQHHHTLEASLRQICEALHAQAEPRQILVSLQVESRSDGVSDVQITTLALIVNELATNAIKHAFEEEKGGHIRIIVRHRDDQNLVVIVDDDGLPFPELGARRDGGLGLGLVQRLMQSIGGLIILPSNGSKCFEIRVPVTQ
ncbi:MULTISPECIES: sensor histidine kinase [unclassified Sphingomonas]|uniref:sensor histidine kinase n=1 Tax=unclassified Sphingomonas TaxID=196159 RepID=UPI001F55FF06|nr:MULTISPECIES: sensor histidine kinase [unclassified Sphingomonas]